MRVHVLCLKVGRTLFSQKHSYDIMQSKGRGGYMLPPNAREGDFVEVSCQDNSHYGMVGRIKQLTPSKATVDIFGKLVDIDKKDLHLRARIGSRTHEGLTEQINARETPNLDEMGYDGLIDFALDSQEWEWAKELVERKMEYVSKKKKAQ